MKKNPDYINEKLEKNYESSMKCQFGYNIFDFNLDQFNTPYIYHAKALEILCICLKNCDDQQLLR